MRVVKGVLFFLCLAVAISAICSIGFLADDWRYIYEIERAQEAGSLLSYVFQPLGTAFAWRPLIQAAWLLDYTLFGYHQALYHIPNILVFGLTLWMLFRVTSQLMTKRIAAVTTLFFGLVPTHHEVTIWLSGRTDLYAFFFCLVSWFFYLQSKTFKKRQNRIFSILFFSFALLSKEFAVVLPGVLVVSDLLFSSSFKKAKQVLRQQFPLYSIYGAVLLLYFALRHSMLGNIVASQAAVSNAFHILPRWVEIKQAVVLFLSPLNASVAMETIGIGTVWIQQIVFLLLTLVIIGIVFLQRKQWKTGQLWRWIGFAVLISVLFLLPQLHLIRHITPDLLHSRLLYSASAGTMLLCALLIWYQPPSDSGGMSDRSLRIALTSGICLLFTVCLILNYLPWKKADQLTETVLASFEKEFSHVLKAIEPTRIYIKGTPSEIQGAYVFHDYYSFPQAVSMRVQNPNVTVLYLDTPTPSSDDFCSPEALNHVVIGQWQNTQFVERKDLKQHWEDVPETTPFTWNAEELQQWKAKDMRVERRGDEIVLSRFGERPRFFTVLPKRLQGWHVRTLSIHGTAFPPELVVGWSTAPKHFPQQTFATTTTPQTIDVPLCRYPAWVGNEIIGVFGFNLPAYYEGEVRLKTVELLP